MGRKLDVAAIQMDVTPASIPERLDRATDLISGVAKAGAQLIVLPELFNTGYEFHERNYSLAEPIDGETVTWMKAQTTQHDIHLVGTFLLCDETDIYNSAVLVAPDGRIWRYDKRYVPFWERAYFRGGEQITVANTDLGKLGMMICWDHAHPDLWAQYAGKVDAMVIMSCPGDVAASDLIFPDGFRTKFMNLVGTQLDDVVEVETDSATDNIDPIRQQGGWMGVPVVVASATGMIRTKLPLIEIVFPGSSLADRAAQAPETILECGFPPETRVINADGEVLAQGTVTDDGVVFAELEFPDTPPRPEPEVSQPKMNISPEIYRLSDEVIPALMLPLYEESVSQVLPQEMSVEDSFSRFGAKDYHLNPHTGTFARWVSTHYWLVFLLFVSFILLTVLVTVFQVENIENVYAGLRLELTYPYFSYKRCFDFKHNGDRYIYIYSLKDEISCTRPFSSSQPIEKAGWFSEKESRVTAIIRDTVFDTLPVLFSLFFSIVVFLRFIRKVPRAFLELAKAGRLKPPVQTYKDSIQDISTTEQRTRTFAIFLDGIRNRFNPYPRSWNSFADDLEMSVRGLGGKVLFVFWLVLGYLLAFIFAQQLDVFETDDFWIGLYYFVVLGLGPVILAYVAGFGIWTLFVIATYIRKLTPTFEIDIQPEHGDLCGGLKRVGDLCFEMAMMIIIPSIVIASFVLLGSFEASIPAFQIFVIIAILTAIIVAALVFFWPLLDLHLDMIKTKEALQDEAMSRIAPVKARLRELVSEGKLNDEETNNLEKQLEKLNQLYPADMKYPVWPFTTSVILIFYTSQIVPIITVITGLIEFSRLIVPNE